MAHEIRSWAGWWTVFALTYLLLAGSLQWAELVAGTVLAGLAALAVTAARTAGHLHFAPRLRWLAQLRRLPGRILADYGIVGAALWRTIIRRQRIEGAFRTIPFDAGDDDPVSAARRALVTVGACLAPNTYVVAIDFQRGSLLVHQLIPSAQPPGDGDKEWPL
ncbi:MAG TPA: Na+/H+ antiporter subunit E [Gemmataceae bacterium]|nr:Na+/H+ antiporter subunit E [Gemmataceae bacterium]